MATFYPSSTDQKKTPANLYLRDPAGPEPVASSNMVYFNFSPVGSYSNSFAGSREPQANCIGASYLSSSHLGENAYSSWRAGGGSFDVGDELLRSSAATDDDPHMSLQTQSGIFDEHNLSLQQSMSGGQGQGLSLRLGMQIPVSNPANGEISNGSASPYELRKTTVLDSKYIIAAQQLLDEVVNLQKALKQKADNVKSIQACRGGNEASRSDGNCANSPGELSASEKQELQNKMIKLLAMLDEVDRRYKRYFNEMQIVDSSFDTIAGSGAAKPYTALALQTISQHFRCLRDAIGSQIRSSQKLLGEQDGSNGKGCGISRLRYIDQHIRQQRAMQQYGVMPQHAWRPQRGLPENSVSILRAWLFEHFLHPYPNDSEKLMLAKQTGLTRSQISNWFINARVRLWKPMVEDIYKEEFGENEMDSNSSSENATKYMDELTNNAPEAQQSPSNERFQTNQSDPPAFQNEPTDQRTHDPSGINPLLLHDAIYHADETSRYDNGGGVSLTLGLQHCEGNLPASEAQEEFLASPSIAFGPSQLLKYFVA